MFDGPKFFDNFFFRFFKRLCICSFYITFLISFLIIARKFSSFDVKIIFVVEFDKLFFLIITFIC